MATKNDYLFALKPVWAFLFWRSTFVEVRPPLGDQSRVLFSHALLGLLSHPGAASRISHEVLAKFEFRSGQELFCTRRGPGEG